MFLRMAGRPPTRFVARASKAEGFGGLTPQLAELVRTRRDRTCPEGGVRAMDGYPGAATLPGGLGREGDVRARQIEAERRARRPRNGAGKGGERRCTHGRKRRKG